MENICHIVKQWLHQETWDWRITREYFALFFTRVQSTLETMPIHLENRTSFDTLKNQWKLLHKQKGQRINYHLITIWKCIELFCYTKCLVTCCNYYFVSGMYNIRKMATPWHKVFNIYKSYSVQVAKKKKNLIHWKYPFFHVIFFIVR